MTSCWTSQVSNETNRVSRTAGRQFLSNIFSEAVALKFPILLVESFGVLVVVPGYCWPAGEHVFDNFIQGLFFGRSFPFFWRPGGGGVGGVSPTAQNPTEAGLVKSAAVSARNGLRYCRATPDSCREEGKSDLSPRCSRGCFSIW